MNISRDYLIIRDTHVRVTGSIVNSLTASFFSSLVTSKKYESFALRHHSEHSVDIHEEHAELKELRKHTSSTRSGVKAISNNPSLIRHDVRDEYLKIIRSASKNIYITNPYFVPGWKFIREVCRAAQRKVDVRIMIPYSTDHDMVDKAARKFLPRLIKSGVRVFLYRKKGIQYVHAKTMCVDGKYSTIGSSNLDYVSLTLNYELNLFFSNVKVATELQQQFYTDLEYCTEATVELLNKEKGGLWSKIKEGIGYGLLGPVLRPDYKGYD
jgi:cardiolipin synthase